LRRGANGGIVAARIGAISLEALQEVVPTITAI